LIPPETLARLKERTDVVSLIGETVRLVRRGRSFVGLCPFHKEKSPSFHVHPERGFFHCFGCQESGSAIDFVMKSNGLTFVEAVRFLAAKLGIEIEEVDGREQQKARSERDELYAALAIAATFFEGCLGRGELASLRHALGPLAEEELQKRGMPAAALAPTPPEDARSWATALADFRIGYAPANWDALARHLAAQGVRPVVGERAGLLVAGQRGHYDRFRHRLMFAVVDVMGRVIGFSGRALRPPSREELASAGRDMPSYDGEAPAKYINSPESLVYKKGEQLFGLFQARQGIRQRGETLVVEGNFDVVTLHAAGFAHAVAPLGTAFTPEQAKLLKRFAQKVVVAFDGDAAGKKATKASRAALRDGGLDARVATLPQGKDPDAYLREAGAAKLEELLVRATPLLEFLIQDALDGDRFGGASLTERVARVRAVTEILKAESDPNLRLMAKRFADKLSQKLVVGNSAAEDLRELERLVESAFREPEEDRRVEPKRSTEDKLALAVVGALLDYPELCHEASIDERLGLLTGAPALAVARIRKSLAVAQKSPLDAGEFLATLPDSIQTFAAGRFASPVFADVASARGELLENLNKLGHLSYKKQKVADLERLEKAPSADDELELLAALSARARARAVR
jgi:DNA primase